MSSEPEQMLESLLSPSVAALLAAMNLGKAVETDVTLLSALPYIPSGNGSTTFYPTTIARAIEIVNPSKGPAVPNTSAGVNKALLATAENPSGPDLVFTTLAPLLTAGSLPATDGALIDSFYRVGKAVFVKLLLDQIVEQNGSAPGSITGDTAIPNTSNPSGVGGALTINALLDLVKSDLVKAMPMTDSRGKQLVDLTQFLETAAGVVGKTISDAIPSTAQRDFLLGKQQQSALTQLGLGPWLTLSFYLSFVTNPDSTFVDQIYARYAIMQAIRIAFRKLSLCYDPAVPAFATGQISAINAWVSGVLPKMLPTLTSADFQQTIVDVTKGAAVAHARSLDLSNRNKTLGDRLSLAGNLEIRKEAQDDEVKRVRRAVYGWTIAYIAVLAASAFLISTDRLTGFLLLALSTLAVMAAVAFGAWIHRRLVRRGFGNP